NSSNLSTTKNRRAKEQWKIKTTNKSSDTLTISRIRGTKPAHKADFWFSACFLLLRLVGINPTSPRLSHPIKINAITSTHHLSLSHPSSVCMESFLRARGTKRRRLTHALGTNSLYAPEKRGGDDAESGIPSPLGAIPASWYSTAMTSRHNAVLSMLGENVYHG